VGGNINEHSTTFKQLYVSGKKYTELPEGCKWSQLTKEQLKDQLELWNCPVRYKRANKDTLVSHVEKMVKGETIDAPESAAGNWNAHCSARLCHLYVDPHTRDEYLDSGKSLPRHRIDAGEKTGERFWEIALARYNDPNWRPNSKCTIVDFVNLDPSHPSIKLPQPIEKLKLYHREIRKEFRVAYKRYQDSGNHEEEYNFWKFCQRNEITYYLYMVLDIKHDAKVATLEMVLNLIPEGTGFDEGLSSSDDNDNEDYELDRDASTDEGGRDRKRAVKSKRDVSGVDGDAGSNKQRNKRQRVDLTGKDSSSDAKTKDNEDDPKMAFVRMTNEKTRWITRLNSEKATDYMLEKYMNYTERYEQIEDKTSELALLLKNRMDDIKSKL